MTDSSTSSADLTPINTPVCAARWWPHRPWPGSETRRYQWICGMSEGTDCELHGCKGLTCRCPNVPPEG
jgi:hypothetical protein